MNELLFAKKVRQLLNRAPLEPQVEARLKAAREAALERQRPERSPALAWADNVRGRLGGWSFALYAVAALALLVVAAAGVQLWQQDTRLAELEEIDSQLLTDDLPPEAYLDRGFQNWLKQTGADQ